jgi:hypothetical protein
MAGAKEGYHTLLCIINIFSPARVRSVLMRAAFSRSRRSPHFMISANVRDQRMRIKVKTKVIAADSKHVCAN